MCRLCGPHTACKSNSSTASVGGASASLRDSRLPFRSWRVFLATLPRMASKGTARSKRFEKHALDNPRPCLLHLWRLRIQAHRLVGLTCQYVPGSQVFLGDLQCSCGQKLWFVASPDCHQGCSRPSPGHFPQSCLKIIQHLGPVNISQVNQHLLDCLAKIKFKRVDKLESRDQTRSMSRAKSCRTQWDSYTHIVNVAGDHFSLQRGACVWTRCSSHLGVQKLNSFFAQRHHVYQVWHRLTCDSSLGTSRSARTAPRVRKAAYRDHPFSNLVSLPTSPSPLMFAFGDLSKGLDSNM